MTFRNPPMFRHAFREYDEAAHAALCDNRELYIAQSAASVGGRVATLPVARSRSLVPLHTMPAAALSSTPPAAAGVVSNTDEAHR